LNGYWINTQYKHVCRCGKGRVIPDNKRVIIYRGGQVKV